MPITQHTFDGKTQLRIDGEMTIYTAAELAAPLFTQLQTHAPLDLDLSMVSELDSAGLQLLMAAKRESERSGMPLSLSGHSQAVIEVFELCDLSGFFGDPLVLSACSATQDC